MHRISGSVNIPNKCYLFWFRSITKLSILRQHQFDFLHYELSSKHNTGFNSSIKVSMKNVALVKTFLMEVLSILFRALE